MVSKLTYNGRAYLEQQSLNMVYIPRSQLGQAKSETFIIISIFFKGDYTKIYKYYSLIHKKRENKWK